MLRGARGAVPSVVCLSVISEPQKSGGLGLSMAIAPQKKKCKFRINVLSEVACYVLSVLNIFINTKYLKHFSPSWLSSFFYFFYSSGYPILVVRVILDKPKFVILHEYRHDCLSR
jgi:hypothetical protein